MRCRRSVRIREGEPGRVPRCHTMSAPGRLPNGYYAWRRRPPSAQTQANEASTERIRSIHAFSQGTYGMPRVHGGLAAEGEQVSRKRVARLMRAAGLQGVSRRKRMRTTVRAEAVRPAPDLVDRKFSASAPNQLWVADITYVPTWAGFLYLTVVIDAFARRVVEWSMANHLRTELVLNALNMALWQRRPKQVTHHSDQGCQYTSIAFGKRCRDMGVRPSMGLVGYCFDNAMCGSFFATLESELIYRQSFRTQAEARMAHLVQCCFGSRQSHRQQRCAAFQPQSVPADTPDSSIARSAGWPPPTIGASSGDGPFMSAGIPSCSTRRSATFSGSSDRQSPLSDRVSTRRGGLVRPANQPVRRGTPVGKIQFAGQTGSGKVRGLPSIHS